MGTLFDKAYGLTVLPFFSVDWLTLPLCVFQLHSFVGLSTLIGNENLKVMDFFINQGR